MGKDETASEIVGKKIFFLYPTVVVQNRIVSELVQQEYEVYIVKDKDSLRRVLRKYPGSLLFIDINEQMAENEWETWINNLMKASDTKSILVGIVTANDNEPIKQKYLSSANIRCGYTVLKYELDKAIVQIIDILQSTEAKGRRKYIRASTGKESNATLNLPLNGMFVKGKIKDISVVGMSCTLEGDPDIAKNALFKDIQIRLQSSLLKAEGLVFGSRMEGKETVYVILFTQRIDPNVRTKIRVYIQQNLQAKMDSELK
ncbi:MAG: pilus assembly protein PilZ [Treponema sp.]|nr:pilus assembly protein PilZ [Treponema sp.]